MLPGLGVCKVTRHVVNQQLVEQAGYDVNPQQLPFPEILQTPEQKQLHQVECHQYKQKDFFICVISMHIIVVGVEIGFQHPEPIVFYVPALTHNQPYRVARYAFVKRRDAPCLAAHLFTLWRCPVLFKHQKTDVFSAAFHIKVVFVPNKHMLLCVFELFVRRTVFEQPQCILYYVQPLVFCAHHRIHADALS